MSEELTPNDESRFGALAGAADVAETIEVTIMYRNNFDGGDGWTYYPARVTISAFCPVCGTRRGQRRNYRFCEDGEWFDVECWNNPCGHIDSYGDVWREAKALREAIG